MCNNVKEAEFSRGDIAHVFGLNSTEMSNGEAARYSDEMRRLEAAGKLDRSTLPSAKKAASGTALVAN